MTTANAPQVETSTTAGPTARIRGWRSRPLLLVPLLAFAGLAVFLGIGLNRDPSIVPSALIGKPVPLFSLPPVKRRALGLSSADLKGQVSLVNVFASWCVACREEHPLLMRMKEEGVVPIHGLNYKDKPEDAARWLDTMGDPYARTGADLDGRVAIDWGVYGVPETYVIDRQGRIAFKQIGPITPEVVKEKILPLIEELRR
ncbi:MAG: DsbE family thiol:disulfide interchange protein [Alphaproteobacteria bacterium]|nr:DsbE family thiol:disulfide interchange protein [Alphaproteobacteria bacterium]